MEKLLDVEHTNLSLSIEHKAKHENTLCSKYQIHQLKYQIPKHQLHHPKHARCLDINQMFRSKPVVLIKTQSISHCINHHVSCIMYHVSCIIYHVSCIMYPLSCILYHVSCIMYHVSCCIQTCVSPSTDSSHRSVSDPVIEAFG